MKHLSDLKRYEEAAVLRDQIDSLSTISQKQLALSPLGDNEDVVALAREGDSSCGVVMKIREGKMLGSEAFFLSMSAAGNDESIFDAFLELYYHRATDIPPTIHVQTEPNDAGLIERWLTERTGRRTTVRVPKRGEKKKLVDLAYRNAHLKILSTQASRPKSSEILREVKKVLGLTNTPHRIEAFDISNIHGAQAVGSMVTFQNGRPLKSGYRHYKIRDVEGIDDVAMIREVLKRRLRHVRDGKDRHPDLIVVDGGAGQLGAARGAMDELEIKGTALIGLAKKNEEIYREGEKNPLRLPRRSEVLRLLQRLRNEAHRFAIEYHRKLRSRELEHSELDEIPGIGERRKILLLTGFGSVDALKGAGRNEIAAIPGIGEKLAAEIHAYLHGRRR
jgi:excinuclease ABC subunit C